MNVSVHLARPSVELVGPIERDGRGEEGFFAAPSRMTPRNLT
jgi:hypothetical protein